MEEDSTRNEPERRRAGRGKMTADEQAQAQSQKTTVWREIKAGETARRPRKSRKQIVIVVIVRSGSKDRI